MTLPPGPPDPRPETPALGSFAALMRMDTTEPDEVAGADAPGTPSRRDSLPEQAHTDAYPPAAAEQPDASPPAPPVATAAASESVSVERAAPPPAALTAPGVPAAPTSSFSSPPASRPVPSRAAVPPATASPANGRRERRRLDARSVRLLVTPPALLLGVVGTAFILMFTLIEPSPRWVVLLGTAATTFGFDGVLRSGRRQAFAEGGLDTAPLLLLPALYMLAVPVFIEHATLGFATPVASLLAGLGYGALVVGALSSVREFDPSRHRGRLIAAAATYFVAFALFALVFLFGVSQRPATVAVGLASVVLAAEILREGEVDPAETLIYALIVGVVVAETRWVLHYLPIDAYAGALTLLLAFYVATGLLHSYVVRALTREVARTYASVGVAGVAFIAAARVVGLA